jgi:GH15 family glucan-1,4-alpha-glucosidase
VLAEAVNPPSRTLTRSIGWADWRDRRSAGSEVAGRYEQRKVKAGAGTSEVGNVPQAFSHLTLILAAHSIAAAKADEN